MDNMGCGLLLCLVISLQMVVAVVGVTRPPAMYVLGDSLLDVGNNNYLRGPRVSRADRLYYGIDYPFRIPTGRFSNGYNIADYVGTPYSALLLLHMYRYILLHSNIIDVGNLN